MNFVTYLDNRFQEANMANANPGSFSQIKFIDSGSCKYLIETYFVIARLLFIPVVVFGYFLTKIGLKRAPAPVLGEAMAKEVHRKQKLAKKIGMELKQQTQ